MSAPNKRLFQIAFSAASAGTIVIALQGIFPSPTQALTLVTSRSALAGNDLLDWSSLGKVFDPFRPNPADFLPNSFAAMSESGLGLNVNIPPPPEPGITPPFVFQTLPIPFGIPTNFASGDFVLFAGATPRTFPSPGNPGPLTIAFSTPVLGAGTQIAVDDASSFTGFVSAFDRDNNLLETFSALGTSSLALDNSALFLGVRSDTPNISKLVYSSSTAQRALGINSVSLVRVSVPESSSLWSLLALGTVGAGLIFIGNQRL
jgi:hypothetical protein